LCLSGSVKDSAKTLILFEWEPCMYGGVMF
jgi:hypothetical protein